MNFWENKTGITLLLVATFLAVIFTFISKFEFNADEALLKGQMHEHGVALAKAISNAIWETVEVNENETVNYFPDADIKKYVGDKIKNILIGTPVLKLKLYNRFGQLMYSSNIKDIVMGDGDDLILENKVNATAIEVVKTKKSFSIYKFRKAFDDGQKIHINKYIFEAYIPIIAPSTEKIGAVVEVYYDITDVIVAFNTNKLIANIMLLSSAVVLFFIISFLIVRNNKITKHKELESKKYLEKLKNKNLNLITISDELTATKLITEKSSEDQSIFMSRVGHELRTPMAAVIGLTDLIMQTSLTDKQLGYINAIQSSGNILLDITDEILTMGRFEAGYLEIKPQHFILKMVIENVLEIMGHRACQKGVELVFNYTPESNREVSCDPIRLRQILINLVGNAIKFTNKGCVSITVKYVDGHQGEKYYRFEIEDTGMGVKEKDQVRIFSAYCHINTYSKSNVKNTGLGLSICKRLIEAMNGTIGMTSKFGKGSLFWFKLPLTTVNQDKNDDFKKSVNAPQDTRILIVAGNHKVGTSVQLSIIHQWGCNSDLVDSMPKAENMMLQSILEKNPYTLFIIDSVIQKQSGLNFINKIRKLLEFDKAHIIIMIPISDSLDVGVASNINKLKCINKPVLPSKLTHLIESIFMPSHIKENNKINLNDLKIHKKPSPLDVYYNVLKVSKILVVEDNPINREIILDMLRQLEFYAKAVDDGHSALNELLDADYDLILLDSRLPDMDGHEVASKIRKIKNISKQPIIIVTSADGSLQNQQISYESGVDDFLKKPITLANLSMSLYSWLPSNNTEKINKNIDNENEDNVVNLFSAPILDKNVIIGLRRQAKDKPEFFNDMIELFINDSFEKIDKLKDQLEDSDFNRMARTAHSIKSGCILIGAMRMAKYCDVLSNMVKNQSYSETRRALLYFTEEFERVLLGLNAEKKIE